MGKLGIAMPIRAVMMSIVVSLLVSSGCASQQLWFSTVKQSSSLADVQESQVIKNFARLAANPGALPFFAVPNTGSATVTDEAGPASLSFVGAAKIYTAGTYGIGANRSVALNWGLAPLNNPDRLKAMRAAYLTVLRPSAVDPFEKAKLDSVIGQDPSYRLAQGWVCVGTRRDVPRDAWLVAHEGRVYAWVMPNHARDFSDFVLLTLNIASVPPSVGPAGAAYGAEVPGPSFPLRLFDQPPSLNPGLFFVPRR